MAINVRWYIFLIIVVLALLVSGLGWYIWAQSQISVPEYGGAFIEGLAGSPLYLNPLLSGYNQVDRDICRLLFDGLTTINSQNQVVPNLATSWEISDDGLEYTFHLRQDVYWHDGVLLTVEDVLFTVRVVQDPAFAGPPELAALWQQVEAEPLDMFSVRFRLPQAYAPFLSYTNLGLLPVHLLDDVPASELLLHPYNRAPIGTGPFQVAELTQERIVLERNPDDFRPRPYVDQVIFYFYPTYQAALQGYRQGQVQAVSRVLPEDVASVWEEEGLEVYSAPLSAHVLVFTNLDSPILGDLAVRQALMYATDRQAIISDVLNGQGVLASGPIMPFSWAYDHALSPYQHDPQAAAQLLEEAGWAAIQGEAARQKGDLALSFQLLVGDDAQMIAVMDHLVRQWHEVGIVAIPRVVGAADLVNSFLRPRSYEAALFHWREVPADPDAYALWHSTQAEQGGQNLAMLRDGEIDLALEMGRLEWDPAVRKRWYDRFQQRFAALAPSLLLYHPIYNYAVSSQVGGVQIGPLLDPSDRFRTLGDWYVKTKRISPQELHMTPEP